MNKNTIKPEMTVEALSPNELMIGNLLHYKGTNEIAIVDLIHSKNHFDCRDEFGSFTPNGEYEPIPLTEERLLSLDFTKRGDTGQYYISDNTLSIHEDGYLFWMSENFGKKVKYVHQLQNLYYLLTGEKLSEKGGSSE